MKSRSLRWRLIKNLILLQIAASVAVLVAIALATTAAGRFVDDGGESTAEIVGGALQHGADGKLLLTETTEVQRLIRSAPSLWFVARDSAGQEVRFGDVPQRYGELVRVLDGERLSLALGEAGDRPVARFKRIDTGNGVANLIVQTGAPLSLANKLLRVMLAFVFLIAPTMLVTALVVVVATPFVIRRGLKGLEATVAGAEQIDIARLGARLPESDVAAEVQPLVGAVNRAFERLDEGYKRQERFLADAAHELRTPIATLRIQVESLPDSTRDKPRLLRSTTRLATLAEQLLDLQRLTQTSIPREMVDLRSVCESVAADLAPLVISSNCSISVDAAAEVPVRIDVTSIERAVANLIQNAVEHGGGGCGIQVRVHAPSTVEVCDSGPGIPEDQRSRIVEPFYRISPRGDGAGLGLHLVAEVARWHGGRLAIGRSELGGASMRLELGA
jgi:signal transduction histidine kinase